MSLLDPLKTGTFLNRERVTVYASLLVIFELSFFVFLVAASYGLVMHYPASGSADFASFYTAGALAADGTPALAYDTAAHAEALRRLSMPGTDDYLYYYPPVFLLVCVVLAQLPYLAAFHAFQAVTFAAYLLVGRAILQEKGWLGWLLLIASPAVYWTAGLGQNAFLTAALLGGGLLLVDKRPILAGILLGLICYKPHFGVLIPVALAAGGHWRAFAGAALCVLLLGVVSLAAFGWESWSAYLALVSGATSSYGGGIIEFAGYVTPFGGARLIGLSEPAAYAVQAAFTGAAAIAVGLVWRRVKALPIRAATLCAAVLVAVPVGLIYDMMIPVIGIFWLVRAARQAGYGPWEKTGLAIIFAVPLVARFPVAEQWHFPLGSVAVIALLIIALACARREMRETMHAGYRPEEGSGA